MSLKTTHGILLKKTFMANDDGVLDFFTSDFGRITCFVPKLARSKKKAAELDFFRLLELGIFEGRNSKRLQSVSTESMFHGFETSYKASEVGFSWLMTLGKILPEGKVDHDFFALFINILGHYEHEMEYLESFGWAKIFAFMGILPRFDLVRGDAVFNVMHGYFYSAEDVDCAKLSEYEIAVNNESRQVLEFLRRSDFEAFMEKRKNLPNNSLEAVQLLLDKIKQFHLSN